MQRRVCILSVAVTLCCLGSVKSSFWTPPNEVACRDPNGVALDWWMLIKLPSGGSYVYADSSTATPGWSFSETRSLTEERQNPIFNTLRHLYENDGPVRRGRPL
uniref:Secreted protein n=1 Tax=Tetraselmis chuii TaxID=63592 RepID=A0A7S1SVK1_9CHLO